MLCACREILEVIRSILSFVTMTVRGLYEPFTHERTFVVITGGTAGVSVVMVLQCFPRCGGGMAMTFSALS